MPVTAEATKGKRISHVFRQLMASSGFLPKQTLYVHHAHRVYLGSDARKQREG
jgi:hypothetical protein